MLQSKIKRTHFRKHLLRFFNLSTFSGGDQDSNEDRNNGRRGGDDLDSNKTRLLLLY